MDKKGLYSFFRPMRKNTQTWFLCISQEISLLWNNLSSKVSYNTLLSGHKIRLMPNTINCHIYKKKIAAIHLGAGDNTRGVRGRRITLWYSMASWVSSMILSTSSMDITWQSKRKKRLAWERPISSVAWVYGFTETALHTACHHPTVVEDLPHNPLISKHCIQAVLGKHIPNALCAVQYSTKKTECVLVC